MKRNIINSNIGITNEIKELEIKTTMIKTLDKLEEILSKHCGPCAGFAILASESPGVVEPVFTTDGINIIRALEFASPIEEFVKQLIIYVGTKVDTSAADGTTSAMLVTISALRELLANITNTSYRELSNAYDILMTKVLEELEYSNLEYTYDKSGIKSIALNQALTSSHGDIVLSELVAEMFSMLPIPTWDYVTFELEKFETNEKYKLVVDKHQYSLKSSVFNLNMLKSELGTTVDEQDTKLVIFTEMIVVGQKAAGVMMDLISDAYDNKEHLCIVCCSNICSQTRTMLENALSDCSKHNINVFLHNVENPQINDLINLQLIRGLSPTDYEKQYIPIEHAKVVFKNGELFIDNIYDNPDNSIIHPLVDSTEFSLLRATLDRLKELIKQIRTEVQSKSSGNSIRYFQKMYNKLYLSQRAYIKIGGSQHDSSTSIDLVTDTVGATRNALCKGATEGGMKTLKDILIKYKTSIPTYKGSPRYKKDKVVINIIDAYVTAIHRLNKIIGTTENYSVESNVFKALQPADVDRELIKRFGELALKFICSKVILVPDSVWLEKQEKANVS